MKTTSVGVKSEVILSQVVGGYLVTLDNTTMPTACYPSLDGAFERCLLIFEGRSSNPYCGDKYGRVIIEREESKDAEVERLRAALESIAHGVVGIADASMREKILMDIAEKNLKG